MNGDPNWPVIAIGSLVLIFIIIGGLIGVSRKNDNDSEV